MKTFPTYYLSHGGGPWPWVSAMRPLFAELERYLRALPSELPRRPKAILVVSGHWEEEEFTVSASPRPSMIYDYGGFPEHTYRIHYDAPGNPALASQVKELVQSKDISASLDSDRGFDHGTYALVYPMYPEAEIPIVQLSLRRDLDPKAHLDVGKAIAPLRDEGVLILGSGNSFHNLRPSASAVEGSHRFDAWLRSALLESSGKERSEKLKRWSDAPSASLAHPREEHLIPLLVAAGAAENDPAALVNEYRFMGDAVVSSFRFG